jgi:membrane fusion protein (multidrug efflux system)
VTHTLQAAPLRNVVAPLALALLLLSAAALSGCNQANGKAKDEKQDAAPAVPVEVAQPKVADMVAVYSGTASIKADRVAFVTPKVSGEIRAVLAEEGDQVKAGQVLARLDGDQLRLEVAQAEANLRKLERDYERNLELQKRGLVSSMAFDNLKYELDAARATYELTALRLSYTSIRSPIAGVVTSRMDTAQVGNTVTPVGGVIQQSDMAMFEIIDFNSLVLEINVPEGQLSKLAVGQPAEITADAVPGKVFAGRISLITPRVDAQTATFPVKIEVSDPEGMLRPGMFARVGVVFDRREGAIQVPRSALLDDEGPPAVFVVEDGKARERTLELGLSNGNFVEVLSGVGRDDQVVTVGQGALKDGTEVRVVNEPAPATAG